MASSFVQTILKYIEYAIGRVLASRRGYDAAIFVKTPPFAAFPSPTLDLTSPDCGPSESVMSNEYSMFGGGLIPSFSWAAGGPDVKEYILISEDVDAPLGHPNVHGIYCFIPASTTGVTPADFEEIEGEGKGNGAVRMLKSGWRVGKNRRGWVYIPPRPIMGHGPHRYFWELVALKEKLDPEVVSEVPTKEELAKLVEGKVVGWGQWVGVFTRNWE